MTLNYWMELCLDQNQRLSLSNILRKTWEHNRLRMGLEIEILIFLLRMIRKTKKGYRPNGRRPFSILYYYRSKLLNFCQAEKSTLHSEAQHEEGLSRTLDKLA
jgi:hypothetical protein